MNPYAVRIVLHYPIEPEFYNSISILLVYIYLIIAACYSHRRKLSSEARGAITRRSNLITKLCQQLELVLDGSLRSDVLASRLYHSNANVYGETL